MITAEELRIGNLILDPHGTQIEVHSHSFVSDPEGWYEIEDCSGIPITPEWLERLGFKYDLSAKGQENHVKIFENRTTLVVREINGLFGFVYHKELQEYSVGHSGFVENSVHIKYIHQLQNLCFALTGTELTVKEKV